jgi:hypothetical protein
MGMWPGPERDASGLPARWFNMGDALPAPDPTSVSRTRGRVRLERGRDAAEALMRVMGDQLLAIMLRRSFRPVEDLDVVPILPCPDCLDGGLRLAGTVRERTGRQWVRACDTCGVITIGERRVDTGRAPGSRRLN